MEIGRGAINHWLLVGLLHPLHRGVYAWGHPLIARRGRWMAAVLACGPTAVLSHRDAAAHWGIRKSARREIDVTVVARGRKGHDGITLHQVRSMDRGDHGLMERIPVTSLPRTFLDLAEVVKARELQRALEEAERLRLLDVIAIEQLLARSPGRRGTKPLARALTDWTDPPPTRSEFERIFLDFCDHAGLPAPVVNSVIAGFEVDLAWPEQKLVVELDSREWHDNATAFETDRVRDAVLQLDEDYRVVRVTWRRLRRESEAVARSLKRALATAR